MNHIRNYLMLTQASPTVLSRKLGYCHTVIFKIRDGKLKPSKNLLYNFACYLDNTLNAMAKTKNYSHSLHNDLGIPYCKLAQKIGYDDSNMNRIIKKQTKSLPKINRLLKPLFQEIYIGLTEIRRECEWL